MVGRAEVGVWGFVVRHCWGSGSRKELSQSPLWGSKATSYLRGRECQHVLPGPLTSDRGLLWVWQKLNNSVYWDQEELKEIACEGIWLLHSSLMSLKRPCPERCAWKTNRFSHNPGSSTPLDQNETTVDLSWTGQSQPPVALLCLLSLLPQSQNNLWEAVS